MNELQMRALFAGVLFGLWPLFMNRSGLQGHVSSAVFSIGVLLIVMPFALSQMDMMKLKEVSWMFAVFASITAAVGVLAFNGGLAITTKETVGVFVVTMTVVQIIVPAVYHIVMSGQVTMAKLSGFALAITAAYLLNR